MIETFTHELSLFKERGVLYFYKEMMPYVERWAYSLTEDWEEAREIALTSFGEAIIRKETINDPRHLKNWVTNKVKHLFLHRERDKKTFRRHIDGISESSIYANENNDTIEECLQKLREFIPKLQPHYAQVMQLTCDGYSIAEISEITNKTYSAVSGIKDKAIFQLREMFNDEYSYLIRKGMLMGKRNRNEVSEKRDIAVLAYKLRQSGMSYELIARELGTTLSAARESCYRRIRQLKKEATNN